MATQLTVGGVTFLEDDTEDRLPNLFLFSSKITLTDSSACLRKNKATITELIFIPAPRVTLRGFNRCPQSANFAPYI